MPEAWYRDDLMGDPAGDHHLNPQQFIDFGDFYDLTGVEYVKIDVHNLQKDVNFQTLRKNRGYDWEDVIIIDKEHIPLYDYLKGADYESAMKKFYTEHLHEEEEVRLVLDGSGFFDVRDKNDRWIRIKVQKGDLLILPAGIYHRFTSDRKKYTKIMRLYARNHVWYTVARHSESSPVIAIS